LYWKFNYLILSWQPVEADQFTFAVQDQFIAYQHVTGNICATCGFGVFQPDFMQSLEEKKQGISI
jgi:hypothetical protein